MRILVPLDGSTLAERALEPAAQLLRRQTDPSTLILVRAVGLNATLADSTGFAPLATDAVLEEALAAAHTYLHEVAHRPLLDGISVETTSSIGQAVEMICIQAKDLRADLILLTSHARSGLLRLAVGSVAEGVARVAPVPTIIIRPEGVGFPAPGEQRLFRILVPLNGTPLAQVALDPAVALACTLSAELFLLYVLPMPVCDTQKDQAREHEAEIYLAHVHHMIEAQGVRVQHRLAWGGAAEQIEEYAARYHADLIAMATHGRSGLERRALGSVTEHVLHRVALPMLVIHPSAVPTAIPASTSSNRVLVSEHS